MESWGQTLPQLIHKKSQNVYKIKKKKKEYRSGIEFTQWHISVKDFI